MPPDRKKNRAPPKVSGDENENEALVRIAFLARRKKQFLGQKLGFVQEVEHLTFSSSSLSLSLSFSLKNSLSHLQTHSLSIIRAL